MKVYIGTAGPFEGVNYEVGIQSVDDRIAVRMLDGLFADNVKDLFGSFRGGKLSKFLPESGSDQVDVLADIAAGNGKKYEIVAGVIRNSNDGNGWVLITEPAVLKHSSLNVDSVSNDDSVITINYAGMGAKKTVSFLCGPDDTFQRAGLFVGASVTEANATIACHFQKKKVCDYISYNGSAWVSQAGVVTNFAFNAGVLTLTHPKTRLDSLGYDCQVTARGTAYACQAGSISQTTTDITWTDWAGALITAPNTNMKAFFSRGEASWDVTVNENPNVLHTANYPGSNIWFIGIFEV